MSVIDQIDSFGYSDKGHAAGAFSSATLKKIEALLPSTAARTCETGCGKTTILFSVISDDHTVFTLDDTKWDSSSVLYYRTCPVTRLDRIKEVFGPTQDTLPRYEQRGSYDIVLIDGPHGYPFPELEYYYLYPYLREGGVLIIDDVHIPTIGRLADFIREDDMFKMVALIDYTALFQRTSRAAF